MRKKNLIPLLAVFFIWSCANDDNVVLNDEAVDSAEVNDANAIPGILRIKVTPETADAITLSLNENGIAQTGVSELDEVAKNLSAVRIERTFKYGGKYENRRRKAQLHLWYNIYYDENTTYTRANRSFSDLSVVTLTEPVYEIASTYTGIALSASEVVNQLSAKAQTRTYSVAESFNDPELDLQWHYQNDGTADTGFLAGADINLYPAWEITTGDPKVIVAVMDNGFDYDHEDLAANVWINEVERAGTSSTDDDGNGYIDDVYGWNFVANSNEIEKSDHGTHVAGTIAAVNNNGIGVCGVAGGSGSGGVKVMNCQVLSGMVSSASDNIGDAFAYAADNGAIISQNSWGFTSSSVSLPASIQAGIDYFIAYAGTDEEGTTQVGLLKGGIVIFATGNTGKEERLYPYAYDEVLSVTAMGPDYKMSSFATRGTLVDVAAPGGNSDVSNKLIYSTFANNTYGYMEGTSQACPHVSGIAALLVSHYGVSQKGITGYDIRRMIENNTQDIYAYNPTQRGKLGTGYVDAYKALTGSDETGTTPSAPSNVTFNAQNKQLTCSMTIAANAEGYIPNRYEVFYSTTGLSGTNLDQVAANVVKVDLPAYLNKEGEVLSTTFADLQENTSYYVAIRAWNLLGISSVAYYETATFNNNPPNDITNLSVQWEDDVALVRWSVTSDPDDGKASYYNLYYSTENLQNTDWSSIPSIYTEVKQVGSNAIGTTLTTRLYNLAKNTVYYFAVQGLDDKTNVSNFAYAALYTGENTAPTVTVSLPEMAFESIGQAHTIDLSEIFANDDPIALTYAFSATPNDVLSHSFSGTLLTLTSLKSYSSTGTYIVTATDFEGLSVSATSTFTSTGSSNGATASLYPNPVVSVLNVAFPNTTTGTVEVSIYKTSGARVIHESAVNTTTMEIDMSKLSSGIYSVVLKYNAETTKRSITKL